MSSKMTEKNVQNDTKKRSKNSNSPGQKVKKPVTKRGKSGVHFEHSAIRTKK